MRGNELQTVANGRVLYRGAVASRVDEVTPLLEGTASLSLLCFGTGRKTLVEGSSQGPGLLFRALGKKTAAELTWVEWTPQGGHTEVVTRAQLRGYEELVRLVAAARREYCAANSTVLCFRFPSSGRVLCFVMVGDEGGSELAQQALISAKQRSLTARMMLLLPVDAPTTAVGLVWLECDVTCHSCAFNAARILVPVFREREETKSIQVMREAEEEEQEEEECLEEEDTMVMDAQQHLELVKDADRLRGELEQQRKLVESLQLRNGELTGQVAQLESSARAQAAEWAAERQRLTEEAAHREQQIRHEADSAAVLLKSRLTRFEDEVTRLQGAQDEARREEKKKAKKKANVVAGEAENAVRKAEERGAIEAARLKEEIRSNSVRFSEELKSQMDLHARKNDRALEESRAQFEKAKEAYRQLQEAHKSAQESHAKREDALRGQIESLARQCQEIADSGKETCDKQNEHIRELKKLLQLASDANHDMELLLTSTRNSQQ